MADKKISALTGASTPLTGSEVLPIVQSGSTVKVSIANVTAGRDASALIYRAGLSPADQGGAAAPAGGLFLKNNGTAGANTVVARFSDGTYPNSALPTVEFTGFGGGNGYSAAFWGTQFGGIVFATADTFGGTYTANLTLANGASGDATVNKGNLVIGTAGKGITTGSAIPLGLGTNNSVTAVTIDTSGNVGVGAAPNATSGRNITVNSVESSIALVTSGARSFTIASGGNFQYTPSVLAFVDNTASATRMVIDAVGNVGIGTAAPAATALLDVQSTTKGVRFPNMTTTQKNAITPSAGTVIFDTTLAKLCVYSGSAWQTITSI